MNKLKQSANEHFDNGSYRKALNEYTRYKELKSADPGIKLKIAICNYHLNQIDEANTVLISLVDNGHTSAKEIWYYLGLTQLAKNEFKGASISFKKYLGRNDLDQQYRIHAIELLKNCEVGMELNLIPGIAYVENLGDRINTIYDECYPIYSPYNDDQLYFASSVAFQKAAIDFADFKAVLPRFKILISEMSEGEWKEAVALEMNETQMQSTYPLSFFSKGKEMIIYQEWEEKNRILVKHTITEAIQADTSQSRFYAPVFPNKGDQALFCFSDSLLLFSSKRPGGYGGYDLYYVLKNNGLWGEPVNLGNAINSPFDDTGGFITKDGNRIYFSSNRYGSLGGYDIFFSDFLQERAEWSIPVNAGIPINSVADDLHLDISKDGHSGIFSSDRTYGYGGYDIYTVAFSSPIANQLSQREISIPEFVRSAEHVVEVEEEILEPVFTEAIPIIDSSLQLEIIEVNPIYYDESELVLNQQTLDELDRLYDILQSYPKVELSFISHSSLYEGPIYLDLYFSMRRAEQLVEYLAKKGINPERLHLFGMGSHIPYISRNEVHGMRSPTIRQLNRRIEMIFHGTSLYGVELQMKSAGLSKEFLSSQYLTMMRHLKDISYKVQLAYGKEIYKDDILHNAEFAMVEKHGINEEYRYTLGWTDNLSEIQRLWLKIKSQGHTNASIEVYLDGKHLTQNEARLLKSRYPELGLFIE
jgi:outer membrane protein OmpA-like peptidoglycan-associated protein